jgi:glycosyltransferase involved in cell wall biosynthesis
MSLPGATAACAVLLPIRQFGGHEKMLVEWLATAAAQHGLRVQIYSAPNERLARACEAAGLRAPQISHPARAGSLRDFFVTWRLLGAIPGELPILFSPGVVQALPLQWLAALLRRRRLAGYVPMAYSSRRMGFRGGSLRDWLIGHVVRRVHVWITISHEQRRLLITQWGVKAPVLVVPNVLALPRAARAEAPGDGPLRVLFAGRFDANQKGLDWLCEQLRARRQAWIGRLRFTFMGQGEFQAQLARLSGELGGAHLEVRPWGDVGAAMAAADVLVLPSRFEGVPLVGLEAVHYGLPVVATRDAGVAGFAPASCLFDFGDARAMWATLEALRDPAARAAALAHSRARVRQSLSPALFRQAVERTVAVLARIGPPPATTS